MATLGVGGGSKAKNVVVGAAAAVVVIFFLMVIFCGIIIGYSDLSQSFWMIFVVMIIGFLVIVLAVVCTSMRVKSRMRDRRNAMEQIMRKHNETTFAGKGVLAKMSPLGSYIALEFTFDEFQPRGYFQGRMPFVSSPGYYSAQPNLYGNLNQYPQTGGFNQLQPVVYS